MLKNKEFLSNYQNKQTMPQYFLGRNDPIAVAIEVGLLVWLVNSYDIGNAGGSLPGTRALAAGGIFYVYQNFIVKYFVPMESDNA